jgi:hypothetical protein
MLNWLLHVLNDMACRNLNVLGLENRFFLSLIFQDHCRIFRLFWAFGAVMDNFLDNSSGRQRYLNNVQAFMPVSY